MSADFVIRGKVRDTVFLLVPATSAAEAWCDEHLPEDVQRLGQAFAVEHRYIDNIIRGVQSDGLTVSYRSGR